MPSRCPLCGRELDETCERLPAGGGWAHRDCLQGTSERAKAVQEIIATLDEVGHGEVTITVQGGKPIHVKAQKFLANKRIG